MTSRYDTYLSPLASRNAGEAMLRLWSPREKFNTWRRIWLAVAEAQHEVGLPVTQEQVRALRSVVERGITDEEIRRAEEYERELRHDVMAHVHALGDSCPEARPIIHLGMTSQDVVCNADWCIITQARKLAMAKIVRVVLALADFAMATRRIPALGLTHLQPAQPTTVGRRAALWAYELALAHGRAFERGPFIRGLKGATGTQASFAALLGDQPDRVDELERRFLDKLRAGWPDSEWLCLEPHPLTGQTYPRVEDAFTLADLAAAAAVLHRIATDIRLLCSRKELDEPLEDRQVGSSAMPYKRNPMRCERICGLSRFVMNLAGNAYDTAATQWLERTLDDSSNRRLALPEAFLALDGALDLMHNVASGLVVHEAMVKRNLLAELPFLATESILMECVRLGGDRQDYHERIRVHARDAGNRVKQEGLENDLVERLRADAAFHPPALGGELDWDGLLDPARYIGRSVEQTERFVREIVEPLRARYASALAGLGESAPRV